MTTLVPTLGRQDPYSFGAIQRKILVDLLREFAWYENARHGLPVQGVQDLAADCMVAS